MFDLLTFFGLCACAYAAFLLLALSQQHQRAALGGGSFPLQRAGKKTARTGAGILLTLTLTLAIMRDGAGMGSLLAVLVWMVGGVATVLTVTLRR